MRLFNHIKNNNSAANLNHVNGSKPDLPNQQGVQFERNDIIPTMGKRPLRSLNDVYEFFRRDFDLSGYQDALIIPDRSHADANILKIKNDFGVLIDQTKNNYDINILQIKIDIEMRRIAGLIELVKQLEALEETYHRHLQLLEEIRLEVKQGTGRFETIKLSYEIGFSKGLVALSHYRFIKSGTLNILSYE